MEHQEIRVANTDTEYICRKSKNMKEQIVPTEFDLHWKRFLEILHFKPAPDPVKNGPDQLRNCKDVYFTENILYAE
jgi:hypothetical protein